MSSRKIPLTGQYGRGKYATVSEEDYEELSKYKWHVNGGYPERSENIDGVIYHTKMHHHLLGKPEKGKMVDHINRDRLDNRRQNLRVCTAKENAWNRSLKSDNTSGYKGVSFAVDKGRWAAYINHDGKRTHIGYVMDPVEAAKAYDYYANKYHGEYALLNFPNESPKKPQTRQYTSKYRGVYWCKRDKVFRVQIQNKGTRECIGTFRCEKTAALAYNEAASKRFGNKAKLNEVYLEGSG